MAPTSVFATYESRAFPYQYRGQLTVETIAGGVPTDPKVAEGWLRSKLADTDDIIRQMVAETMIERGVSEDEALKLVDTNKHLNGFKRNGDGLYLEGRCLKAALKEAAMVTANAGKITTKKWGNPDDANYKKGIKAWFPEHVFVKEHRLPLGVTEPTEIVQRFVHPQGRSAIQYLEVVENAQFGFTVISDHEFTEEQWAMIWLTGGEQGIGASRSQGFGRYVLTQWEQIK